MSKIYKDICMQYQNYNNLIFKKAEGLNRHFPKETYRWATDT